VTLLKLCTNINQAEAAELDHDLNFDLNNGNNGNNTITTRSTATMIKTTVTKGNQGLETP
jgi:hypothetical protein